MASSVNKICVIDEICNSNPQVLHESTLHPKKITAWCGLWTGGVIGPYFRRDDQDRHFSVNGKRYRSMITEYFWPQLDDIDLEDMWFQQVGATSHTANVAINLLETKFGERVISRNGTVGWPPRSCGQSLPGVVTKLRLSYKLEMLHYKS